MNAINSNSNIDNMPIAIAIDIGTKQIKLAYLNKNNDVIKLNLIKNTKPRLDHSLQQIKNTLKPNLSTDAIKIKQANLCLSLNTIREKIINLNVDQGQTIDEKLIELLQKQHHINFDTNIIKYTILEKRSKLAGSTHYIISLYVLPKNTFYKIKVFLKKMGIDELNLFSKFQAQLAFTNQNQLNKQHQIQCAIDIGHIVSHLIIIKNKQPIYSQTFKFGFKDFINELSLFSFTNNAAEQFLATDFDYLKKDNINSLISNTINIFVAQINRNLQNFNNSHPLTNIEQIYLSGGASLIKNIDTIFTNSLEIPSNIISANTPNALHHLNLLSQETINYPIFSCCIGLSLLSRKNIKPIDLSLSKHNIIKKNKRNQKKSLFSKNKNTLNKPKNIVAIASLVLFIVNAMTYVYMKIGPNKNQNPPQHSQITNPIKKDDTFLQISHFLQKNVQNKLEISLLSLQKNIITIEGSTSNLANLTSFINDINQQTQSTFSIIKTYNQKQSFYYNFNIQHKIN
jgi:Tfp pilus assembly PilM family ATPase